MLDTMTGLASVRVRQVVNGYRDESGHAVRDEAAREARLTEAEDMLARALAACPGHPKVFKVRTVLLRARGLFADALAAAEMLLAGNPGDPIAHREIGLNLLCLGRVGEAVAWFRRVDALGPGDPMRWTWLQGLSRALVQLGRDREAIEVLRQAVASNPRHAPSHALLAAALASKGAAAQAAMSEFRSAGADTSAKVLARRPAVTLEATDPLHKASNARVVDGVRRAAGLTPSSSAAVPVAQRPDLGAAHAASGRFSALRAASAQIRGRLRCNRPPCFRRTQRRPRVWSARARQDDLLVVTTGGRPVEALRPLCPRRTR